MEASHFLSLTADNNTSFKSSLKKLMSVPLGTILQWYDFSLYGSVAVIIAKQFFPPQFDGLITTYLIFCVSFILSPLGALFIGLIGDKFGRKKALNLSILLMTISTFSIAILPGFNYLGIYSTFLLIFFRLLQGVASGVEFTNSAIYLVESAPSFKTLIGCLTSSAYSIGSLLGTLMVYIFINNLFPSWGWRIPFAFSIITAALICYIRKNLIETTVFNQIKQQKLFSQMVLEIIKENRRSVLTTLGLSLTLGILTYGTFVWLISYLHAFLHFSFPQAISIALTAMITDAVLEPGISYLIDTYPIKRRMVSMFGLVLMMVTSFPLFCLLKTGIYEISLLVGIMFGIIIAFICAPLNALMALSFNPKHRCTALGVSFNFGASLFGGTAPLFLSLLVQNNFTNFVPGYYIFASLIGFISVAALIENEQ